MVLKYLIKDYPIQTLYFGIANVVANALVMLRYALSKMFQYPVLESYANSHQLRCSLGLTEHRG